MNFSGGRASTPAAAPPGGRAAKPFIRGGDTDDARAAHCAQADRPSHRSSGAARRVRSRRRGEGRRHGSVRKRSLVRHRPQDLASAGGVRRSPGHEWASTRQRRGRRGDSGVKERGKAGRRDRRRGLLTALLRLLAPPASGESRCRQFHRARPGGRLIRPAILSGRPCPALSGRWDSRRMRVLLRPRRGLGGSSFPRGGGTADAADAIGSAAFGSSVVGGAVGR